MKKICKSTITIIFIFTILFYSIYIPKSIAYTDLFIDETSDRPNRIECSVRLNPETKVVADYNGKDAFSVDDEIKLDVYVETTHINLNCFNIGIGLSTTKFKFVGYELGEEIPEEYKSKFTKQPSYNHFVDYSSGKPDYSPDGIILGYYDENKKLNNSKPFKVFTATFKVKDVYMDLTTFEYYIKNVIPSTSWSAYRMENDTATRDPRLNFDIYDFYVMSKPSYVSITDSTKNMKVNEYKKFGASVYPETAYQGIIWSSSNPSVVTISDDGIVTALKEGSATITAKSVVDPTKKRDYTVNVSGMSDKILIDSVSIINKENIDNLLPDRFVQVETSILPANTTEDKTITYSSSNEEVATIDNSGLIRTLHPGTTTITVKTTNSKTDQYTITVKNPVSKVKIKNKTVGIYLYDYTGYFLDIETEPAGYEDLVKISSSDEKKVATNNTYKSIRALDVGDVKITASVGDVSDSFMVGAFTPEIPAKSITINNKKTEMHLNEELKLDVTMDPNPEDEAVSALNFKVDNLELATINQFGVLKVQKTGTVKVTAYSATTEDSFTVNIIDESGITDVELVNFNGIVQEYVTGWYGLKVTPEDAVGKGYLEVSSSNPDVLEAYRDGDNEVAIGGISPGTADIIISAGESFRKVIPVTVVKQRKSR